MYNVCIELGTAAGHDVWNQAVLLPYSTMKVSQEVSI